MRVRKAVFPAAGWGTRFLPATKAQPKEMLPLVDKPIIQYGVEEAVAAGIEQIIIVTSTHKGAIEDHFDLNYELEKVLEEKGEIEKLRQVRAITDLAQLAYVRQKEQLGLGHAILMAKDLIGHEPFAENHYAAIRDDDTTALRGYEVVDAFEEQAMLVLRVIEDPPAHVTHAGPERAERLAHRGLAEDRRAADMGMPHDVVGDPCQHRFDVLATPVLDHGGELLEFLRAGFRLRDGIFNTRHAGNGGDGRTLDEVATIHAKFPSMTAAPGPGSLSLLDHTARGRAWTTGLDAQADDRNLMRRFVRTEDHRLAHDQ